MEFGIPDAHIAGCTGRVNVMPARHVNNAFT